MKQFCTFNTLFLLSVTGWSQSETKNDLGLLLGGSFISQRTTAAEQPINFGASVAFSADYARRIKSGNASLAIEFPFVAEPSNSVSSPNPQSIVSLAKIFIVPSLRVKFCCQWTHLPLGFRRIWLRNLGRQRVLW